MSDEMSAKIHSLHMAAVNRLFEDLSVGASLMGTEPGAAWRPPTDVFECDAAYVVRMAISGLRHTPEGNISNAEVTIENDVLSVSGYRREDCPHRKSVFYQMEIHYGYFESRVRIKAPFDRDRICAQYRDGFLEILIPKARRLKRGMHRVAVQY